MITVSFNQDLNAMTVQLYLDIINHQRFNKELSIYQFDLPDKIRGWSIKIKDKPELEVGLYLLHNNTLEWKHQYDPLLWWTISTIAALLIKEIEPTAKIIDTDDQAIDDFDSKFPSPVNWTLFLAEIDDETIARKMEETLGKTYSDLLPNFWRTVKNK